MAANYLHGVETIEIERGSRAIRQVKTAVIGIVGTAPIHLVDAADRTINYPTLVLNPRDAAKYFGPVTPGFTIPAALDAVFDQGAGICIVINVFDPATNRTVIAPASFTFASDKITLPQKGILVSSVTNVAATTTYVAGTDYTINIATGVVTRLSTGAIANNSQVQIGFTYANPTLVVPSAVIGAVDGSGNRTGMQGWQDSYSLFGFFPKILISPVYASLTSVTAEMVVQASRLRAIGLADAPIGTTFAQAITGRGPVGAINFNTSSDRLILCYPHVKVYDLATDTEVLEPYSPRLAGTIAGKDIEKGYWWSPSNSEIKGIVGVERRLTAGINDPNSEVNLLNEVGITTIFNAFGTGLRTWGNRTAAWPTVTHPRNFINVRRVADILHESVEFSMLQFLDQPISNGLIDAICQSVKSFINKLIGDGALIGGDCIYNPDRNSPQEISLGHLTFSLSFMPPPPLERITFESVIDINYLKSLTGSLGGNN